MIRGSQRIMKMCRRGINHLRLFSGELETRVSSPEFSSSAPETPQSAAIRCAAARPRSPSPSHRSFAQTLCALPPLQRRRSPPPQELPPRPALAPHDLLHRKPLPLHWQNPPSFLRRSRKLTLRLALTFGEPSINGSQFVANVFHATRGVGGIL